ncbi:hypothetical protein C8J55DRAFT_566943 [Lentinula edodes]|uniref:Retrotransposon gag domain-containing protein n=1 Tax=Lentinula lateritia TaxID=40482 RepID=A0A9W9DDA7_9AGAR|nr:hypothetical protein C8J55DRAFT_566943 [Lentinula edodes]
MDRLLREGTPVYFLHISPTKEESPAEEILRASDSSTPEGVQQPKDPESGNPSPEQGEVVKELNEEALKRQETEELKKSIPVGVGSIGSRYLIQHLINILVVHCLSVAVEPLSEPATNPLERLATGEIGIDLDLGDWSPLDSPVKNFSERQSESPSPTKPRQPKPLTPNAQPRPMATQQPLTRFSGDPDDPIQPATFLQDFEVRMTELMTPRADLASRIKPYLERDSRAWDWYTEDLTATERTGPWEAFETKFHARFPSQKKEKKSAKSYLTSLEGERITHEQIMTTSEDTNQPYHQWWADRLLRLAKGAEIEKTKQSIGAVWKKLPYALKKTVDEEHDNWADFTSAIKAVKWGVLKVEAEHEASRKVLPPIPETPRTKLAGDFAAARISSPPSPSPMRARPAYAGNTGGRKPRRVFTSLNEARKEVLRRGIAAKVQQPNTPEGFAAWKAELLEWASRHGVDGALSELTIVPLKPGTEAVCSGECFRCGGTRHGFEVPCPKPGAIPPVESDWRAYCQRELGGRVARVNAVHVLGPEAIFEGMVESGNGEGSAF